MGNNEKNWVATRNVTFKLEDVKKLVLEKCANIGKEEWEGVCEKVKVIENYYKKTEIAKDNSKNEVIINTESGDDSNIPIDFTTAVVIKISFAASKASGP
ncbi:hypothetical protein J437_LFUL000901 [Ladona fulva]|uniref:Uncharacterized protein n=1 Tax=Ladona fulva TaxID=123851 RepID=A0A8K0K8Z0_LADFU|nr:hypothetical protein J437_LFUL000901 [Ladona fulva]